MSDPVIDDSKFQADNKALLAAAEEVQNEIKEAKTNQDDYIDRLKKVSSDPEIALLQLFFILYASPGDDTMGGGVQDKIGITGARLKLNAALTATGNDLQNMVNSNNDNPQSLTTFANDANKLMGEVNVGGSVYKSMDSQTASSVYTQLQTIRNFFHTGDNPPSSGYYFDPGDSNYIQSFKEYQDLLNAQGDGKHSTDVGKNMTDDFSTNTQTTQTASAVLNNEMKTYSPVLQAIQQFDSAIAQLINAIKKAAINHIASGS